MKYSRFIISCKLFFTEEFLDFDIEALAFSIDGIIGNFSI